MLRCLQPDGTTLTMGVQDVYDPDVGYFDSTLTAKEEDIQTGFSTLSQASYALRFNFTSATNFPTRDPGDFAENINPGINGQINGYGGGQAFIVPMDFVGEYGTGQQDPVAAVVSNNNFAGALTIQSTLTDVQSLTPGHSICSPNLTYRAELQTGSNFVVYRLCDGFVMGATGTTGQNATGCYMQGDGNFVVYAGNTPLWSTGTQGNGAGCELALQNDGNLVVYNAAGQALWSLYGSGL